MAYIVVTAARGRPLLCHRGRGLAAAGRHRYYSYGLYSYGRYSYGRGRGLAAAGRHRYYYGIVTALEQYYSSAIAAL